MDLIKDNGHLYFIKCLDSSDPSVDAHTRAQAAFVLSVLCDGHPKAQALCAAAGLLGVCLKWLRLVLPSASAGGSTRLLLVWLALCLGKLCEGVAEITTMALRESASRRIASRREAKGEIVKSTRACVDAFYS